MAVDVWKCLLNPFRKSQFLMCVCGDGEDFVHMQIVQVGYKSDLFTIGVIYTHAAHISY